jgi:hypothetical protein
MSYNYTEIIDDLIAKAQVPSGDIFEYEFSQISDVYERYFQFCQENLTEECDEFGIQPAKLYYRTEYGINARAGLQNSYFIIGVNMQTIHALYDLFYERNNIFDTDPFLLDNYKELTDKFDIPPGHLMFQLATLFTFYHERAHLIQKSDLLTNSLFEQPTPINPQNFSIERHVIELDADLDAAHKICFHLVEYFKKLDAHDRTVENLQKILSIGVASVFSYFLLYYKEDVKVYYKENTHPHPLVRISYIVDCFVRVAEINIIGNLKLDLGKTIRDGFSIADTFYKSVLNVILVEGFAAQFMAESKKVEIYVNELLGAGESMPYLVKNRLK